MKKLNTVLVMSICFLFIIGLVTAPISAGLKDKLQSDEFEGSELSKIWSVDNPDVGTFEVSGGKLNITAGSGDTWASIDSLFCYQEVSQKSFDISASFEYTYDNCSNVTGLMVSSETTEDSQGRMGEWVTLKMWGRDASNGSNAVVQYQRRQNDAAPYVGTFSFENGDEYTPEEKGQHSVAFRLKREGDTYESWFKPEGKGEWVSISKVTSALQDPVKVGIIAGIGGGAGTMNVMFDNFIEASSAVTPVNPRNRLTTTWGELKIK